MKDITLITNNKKLAIFSFIFTFCTSKVGHCDDYFFDSSMFKGTAYGKNIDQFNHDTTPSGNYIVDIYLNGNLVSSQEKVNFTESHDSKGAQPCLTPQQMQKLQLKITDKDIATHACRSLVKWSEKGGWEFDQASLRLKLTIPMTELNRKPRGYIPPSEWDKGITALFFRHNTNFTWTNNTDSDFEYKYLWSGITAGTNLGKWQLRHQGNFRYIDASTGSSAYDYNSVRTWIQRPLENFNSQISIGDNYTDNSLFGSLSFNGIKLATDERMWPQGKRGYAPEVHGVALSNARVVVKQLDKVVYEVNVPPGPFIIDDLYNTRSQGDLKVEVIEANGKSSTFIVPYSSVPDSVRPGTWHYSVSLGRVRQFYSVENEFFEGILQRGLSNSITGTAGSRLAKDYQAWLVGGVWSTSAGAIGVNSTFSNAKVENDETLRGWRGEVSYSKTFQTKTNLVLAAYRYSTSGFRDLQDVLGVRRQSHSNIDYYSDTLHQRNRLSATVSQSMDNLGLLSLSASTSDYYNNQSRITQLQLGYNNNWKKISYGLNFGRQRTSWNYSRSRLDFDKNQDDSRREKYTENTFSFNVSVPLDWGRSLSSVSYNYNQSKETRSSIVSTTGSLGENRELSYSVYAGTDHARSSSDGDTTTFGANMQQNSRIGSLRANYGQGDHYRQAGLGMSGTVLIHKGGITAGPYTNDTFALIHAEGAEGAEVQNGQGAVVDSYGYAILPSLTPYRTNDVSLNTLKMNPDAELSGGSKRVVPYAGAIAKVNFSTIRGKALLISLVTEAGDTPPMGAEVHDAESNLIGVIGQGGQLYARVPNNSGTLRVDWEDNEKKRCLVSYQLDRSMNESIIHLNRTCKKA